MKYLRWFLFGIAVVVFILPLNIIVTIGASPDQYRKYSKGPETIAWEKLYNWASGNSEDNHIV